MIYKTLNSYLIGACFYLAVGTISAQKEFPLVFKGEFDVEAKWKVINEERTKVLAGDLTELAMVDTKNGKSIWKINFKEKFNQKKCQDWTWDEDLQTIKLIFKGENKDEEKTILLSENTGDVVDKGTEKVIKYVVDRKTKRTKRLIELPEKKSTVSVKYKAPKVVSGAWGKTVKITVESRGDIKWSTEIEGKIVRNLCSSVAFAGFGGDFLDMGVYGDKVVVVYEGISVLDLNTGKLLWTAPFDNSEFDFGLLKQHQTLGKAAMPLVTNDAVYIADLSKDNYMVKKYNLENGQLLWQSPKFDKGAIVPELIITGNTLLARFGGVIERQTHIEGSSNVPEQCKSEPKMEGDYGVKAYDLETGKVLWETSAMKEQLADKFSSSISNFEKDDKYVYVASDKNLYAFEPATGKVKFQIPVSKLKVGNIQELFINNGNLIAEGEEGVASFKMDDGKVNFATNTDKCLGSELVGNAYFVWVGKSIFERNKFVRLDLSTGSLLGKMSDTYRPWFTEDGEEFVKLDGQKLFRYKTKE